jgi:hypothetical protein
VRPVEQDQAVRPPRRPESQIVGKSVETAYAGAMVPWAWGTGKPVIQSQSQGPGE